MLFNKSTAGLWSSLALVGLFKLPVMNCSSVRLYIAALKQSALPTHSSRTFFCQSHCSPLAPAREHRHFRPPSRTPPSPLVPSGTVVYRTLVPLCTNEAEGKEIIVVQKYPALISVGELKFLYAKIDRSTTPSNKIGEMVHSAGGCSVESEDQTRTRSSKSVSCWRNRNHDVRLYKAGRSELIGTGMLKSEHVYL